MPTISFHPATKENQQEIIRRLSTVLQPLAKPTGTRKMLNATTGKTLLTVKDPDDTMYINITLGKWEKTVIVKNADHLPADPSDGTVVTQWTTRNLYKSNGYEDDQATETNYRAFAFATNGEWTASDAFRSFGIVGFRINTQDPDESTCVEYLEDAVDFAPAHMDFENDVFDYGGWANHWIFDCFRPCMLRANGTVHSYLKKNNLDLCDDAGETPSEIGNLEFEGNAMNEVQPIFIKLWEEDDYQYALFSPVKIDDDWECWSAKAHDGSYHPFYLPLFEGYVYRGKLRSMKVSAKPTASTTAPYEYAQACANGANWYTTTFADEMLMRLLGVLVFGRLNSQAALGGTYKSGAAALILNCGTMTGKGEFWGVNMLDSQGEAVDTLTGTKFFGMENWWCHRNRRAQGLNLVGTREFRVKLTPSTIDGSVCEGWRTGNDAADYDGYLKGGTFPTTYTGGSPIVRMLWSKTHAMIPAAAAGSITTYWCDNVYTNAGVLGFLSGGTCSSGPVGGLFSSYLPNAPSYSVWNFGASPSYHTF